MPDVERDAGVSGVLWPVYFVRCNQLYYVFCRCILAFTDVVISPATILFSFLIMLSFLLSLFSTEKCSPLYCVLI